MFKKLREKSKNKKGFTLVELIVVIVIILVLAAVMVPSVLRYVNRAHEANCRADAATILVQLQADVADAYLAGNAFTPANINGAANADDTTPGEYGSAGTLTTGQYTYVIDANGDLTAFGFRNGRNYVNWSRAGGWSEVF